MTNCQINRTRSQQSMVSNHRSHPVLYSNSKWMGNSSCPTFEGDVAGVENDILAPPTSSSSMENKSLLAGIMPLAEAPGADSPA